MIQSLLPPFVVTLREGLEAFLIVAISLAYLKKTDRPMMVSAVHWGIAIAVVVSVGLGLLLRQAHNQALWEAALALFAAVSVTSLIIHMWRTGRRMKANIEGRLEQSAGRTGTAAYLGVLGFTVLMISREGMETAVLMNTILFEMSSRMILVGATAGTLAAATIAWLWSRYGYRINLSRFFQVTAVFLFVFVAQLLIYGFHELMEANIGIPNSEALHAATEAYGPDGIYGHYLSYMLVALPLGWLVVSSMFHRRQPRMQVQA